MTTNTFFENLKKENNKTLTANGAVAYKSTFNKNLDFFNSVSTYRHADDFTIMKAFKDALNEDQMLALANAAYLRDRLQGAGERRAYRVILENLANKEGYENHFKALLFATPLIGRWDDVTLLIDKISIEENKKELVSFIQKQLKSDLISLKEDSQISLLGKWMPSANTKSKTGRLKRKKALLWAKELNMTISEYSKMLRLLKEKLDIVEARLTKKDYSFEYSKLPSKALAKYTRAFQRHDSSRYEDFLDNLKTSDKAEKLNNLELYEIYRLIKKDKNSANVFWDSLPKEVLENRILVVRDGSASMWGLPNEVATSLAIYTAERLTGAFKNKFVTFSNRPALVELDDNLSFFDKVVRTKNETEVANTDINATLKLIYNTTLNSSKEDLPETILLISDMEFDSMTENSDDAVFDYWKQKFEDSGLTFPKIIFWNVNSTRTVIPTASQENLYLVSGFSKNILNNILKSKSLTAYDLMIEQLEPYYDLIIEQLERYFSLLEDVVKANE